MATNLLYPIAARELDIEGKMLVRFVLQKDGSISNVDLIAGINAKINPLFENECYTAINELHSLALDMIKKMPAWSPGTSNGKALNVTYTIPINYKLEEGKKENSAWKKFKKCP